MGFGEGFEQSKAREGPMVCVVEGDGEPLSRGRLRVVQVGHWALS